MPSAGRYLSSEDAPWLRHPAFESIVAALGANRTRATGGIVRDSLTGRLAKDARALDLDVVTLLDADSAKARLEEAGIRAHANPFLPHVLFLTLPRDLEGADHASLCCLDASGDEAFAADARSRDFTANALLCDPDGHVEDHVDGLGDVGARRLRFVSEDTAAADPVRLIRYFRIRVKLGEVEPRPESLDIVRRRAPDVLGANPFRLVREFSILLDTLETEDVLTALRLMERTGLLRAMIPDVDLERFERHVDVLGGTWNIGSFEALAVLGGEFSPVLSRGDWRDDLVARSAARLKRDDGRTRDE